jgi:hypothetical protein
VPEKGINSIVRRAIIVVGNRIGFGTLLSDGLVGMILLIVTTMAGLMIAEVDPIKLPAVFWVSILALLITSPLNPYGAMLTKQYLSKINFLAIFTGILAYAGLAVGKDLKLFQHLSWKIVIVALAVYTGTFLGGRRDCGSRSEIYRQDQDFRI